VVPAAGLAATASGGSVGHCVRASERAFLDPAELGLRAPPFGVVDERARRHKVRAVLAQHAAGPEALLCRVDEGGVLVIPLAEWDTRERVEDRLPVGCVGGAWIHEGDERLPIRGPAGIDGLH
jgi:hypothetical protein